MMQVDASSPSLTTRNYLAIGSASPESTDSKSSDADSKSVNSSPPVYKPPSVSVA